MAEDSRSLSQGIINKVKTHSLPDPFKDNPKAAVEAIDQIILKAFEIGAEAQEKGGLFDAEEKREAMSDKLQRTTPYREVKGFMVALIERDKTYQSEHKTLAQIENGACK